MKRQSALHHSGQIRLFPKTVFTVFSDRAATDSYFLHSLFLLLVFRESGDASVYCHVWRRKTWNPHIEEGGLTWKMNHFQNSCYYHQNSLFSVNRFTDESFSCRSAFLTCDQLQSYTTVDQQEPVWQIYICLFICLTPSFLAMCGAESLVLTDL